MPPSTIWAIQCFRLCLAGVVPLSALFHRDLRCTLCANWSAGRPSYRIGDLCYPRSGHCVSHGQPIERCCRPAWHRNGNPGRHRCSRDPRDTSMAQPAPVGEPICSWCHCQHCQGYIDRTGCC
jgi:hypothetical protein